MYPIIFLTQEEMKARWDKNLCYTCDEVYSFEHRCATIQLYMLKDEEECVEGEVETTEIVFDSGGGLIEVPDPEDSPIKANSGSANSGSDLVSPILNLLELEGVEPEASTILDFTAKKSVREVSEETPPLEAVQELPDENLEVEAVEDLPEEKPSEETNVKWLEEPSIVEIKRVEKLQEASAKVSIDAKGNTQPISITPHNQNLSTLSSPNQNTPPIQTQIFHAINQNTAANLVANRPNPWPNKLPKLTYFIRPKPWPDEPPIHTTTNTNRHTLWPGAIGNFGSPKPRNNIEENNKEGKAYHVLKRVHHRLWPTLERAAAAARLPTPFPGEDRRRSRPVSQLMVLPEFDPGDFRSKEDKGRISFEFNGYLGHFGRIFEGNRRRIEENSRWFSEKRRIGIVLEENRWNIEEEVAGLSKKKKNWDLVSRDFGLVKKKKLKFNEEIRDLRSGIGHFNPRDVGLPKKKKFGILKVNRRRKEVARVSNYLMWEFPRYSVGFVEEEAAIALPEEEEDFGCVEERRSMKKMRAAAVKEGKQTLTPNPISKHSVLYSYNWARWIPIGELGQKHNWALSASIQFFSSERLGRPDHLFNKLVSDSVGPCQDWAGFKIINSFSFGDLGHQYIWATIAIDFPFQVP